MSPPRRRAGSDLSIARGMARGIARGIAGALLLSSTLGCAGEARAPKARRIILVSCDTLRADRLGTYGYGRGLTPHLDAFAEECVVYDNAFALAPMTGPALAALFTGRTPDELGVSEGNHMLLAAEVRTLAEAFARAGIETAAVVSNFVLARPPAALGDVGLAQGFDHYDDRLVTRERNRDRLERLAPDTTAAAVEWLSGVAARDEVFLWVHYIDPHGPYTPPPAVAAPLAHDPPADARTLPAGEDHSGRGQLPLYQLLGDERRPAVYADLYDAEIRYFDEALGALFADLRARGLYEDSLIVFTADHGEMLGEHDYWFCHGETLHRPLVQVPLLIRFPGAGPAGSRVDAVVSHLDVWGTLLDTLDVRPEEGTFHSLWNGPAADGVAVHQVGLAGSTKRWIGVAAGEHHLVVPEPGEPELYLRRGGPGAPDQRVEDDPALVRALLARYEAFIAERTFAQSPAVSIRSDRARMEGLRALGYAGDEDQD